MPEKEINIIFKENLMHLLTQRNMTQSELAEHLGIRNSTVSMWLNSASLPRMELLDKIADVFNISVCDLIEDHDKMSETTDSYYLNDDARELAEFMFKNPEYKVLFDASRKVKKDDIEFVKEMIDRMRKNNE